MPGSNPILRHWQIEVKTFNKNLLLLRKEINAEAVHDLRVAIKKLRSYLKLYSALSGNDIEESFTKTKRVFSALGKNRNVEISKQLLLKFSGNDRTLLNPVLVYLQLLQDQLNEYCRRSIEQYDEKEITELTVLLERALKDFTREEILNKTKDLVTSSLQNAKHDIKHFTEKSHRIRKELKNIFYWAKIFEEGEVLSKAQIKSIDKILEYLGNIQDHEVMNSYLKSFRKTIVSKGMDEYEFVKKIELAACKKKNVLLEQAEKLTTDLVSEL